MRHNWRDNALRTHEVHRLQISKFGKCSVNRGGKSGWSAVDTAKLLGISVGMCSENLRLASFLKRKPSLMYRNISRNEAVSLMRQERERTR